MTKRKKKTKPDMSKLTQSQIEFIRAKVERLGSLEAVEKSYNRDDAVSEFARVCGRVMYGKETK